MQITIYGKSKTDTTWLVIEAMLYNHYQVTRVNTDAGIIFGVKQMKDQAHLVANAHVVEQAEHQQVFLTTNLFTGHKTFKGSTSVSGLTPLTVYYFRHRAVLSSGPSAWEDAVSEVAPR